MKMLLMIAMLHVTFHVFAQREKNIDDLSTIDLNLDGSSSDVYVIDKPNNRREGGNSANTIIYDCLRLDIKYSEALITVQQKIEFANQLRVLEAKIGSKLPAAMRNVLPATIKGDDVVFYLDKEFKYMTYLQVMAVNGISLNEVIRKKLPLVILKGRNKSGAATGLVYVRGCRF